MSIALFSLLACSSTREDATSPSFEEEFRPQFHYTAPKNWLNDPNGLVFYDGEYHLFHQYNPDDTVWGSMHWYHAVSHDLVHWNHLGIALSMEKHGGGHHVYSGSAVADIHNTSGFQRGVETPLVAIYTIHDIDTDLESQNIAFSNDRGRTWTAYDMNPVIPAVYSDNQRDPKVFWFEPESKWVMALFENGGIAFYSSPDLKSWSYLSRFNGESGFHECPDMFELPVDGNRDNTRWIIHDAGRNGYMVGRFDGQRFIPDSYEHFRVDYGHNFYAAQSFSNIPAEDGRRIQVAWMAGGEYPGMPFNQQMSFPCELTLRTFPEGIRLCRNPVKEIERLHGERFHLENKVVGPGENPLEGIEGDLFDITMVVEKGDSRAFGLATKDIIARYYFSDDMIAVYETGEREFRRKAIPLKPVGGMVRLRILVDRTSIELFGNDGRISMSSCYLPEKRDDDMATGIRFFSDGGRTVVNSLTVHKLNSIW